MTGGVVCGRPSSVSKEHTQLSSEAVFATDRFSAYVDERATPLCFLEDHDIG